MKTLKYILLAILPFIAFYSCSDDDATNPTFADDELPRILMSSWEESIAEKIGEVLTFSPDVSPSGGATYKWTLDGEVISTEKDLEYPIDRIIIDGILKFEVTRNDLTNSRTAKLTTTNDFIPKVYNKKSIAFLTKDGLLTDIDWANVTHVVLSSVIVKEDGTLDLSALNSWNTRTLIALAHHYGVYAMLEVSGSLSSYLNSVPVYGSYNFYNHAIGANSETLAKNIVKEVKDLGFDGINIYMDKANTSNGEFGDPAKLANFYSYVAEQMKAEKNEIDGIEYDYLLSLSVVGGWTRGSIRDAAKLTSYDWVNVLALASTDLVPSPHSSVSSAKAEIEAWITGWIGPVSPERLVLVAPAFGIRYFGEPAGYSWANLDTYTEYIPYKTICENHSGAAQQNSITLLDNGGDNTKPVNIIYYDGLSSIKEKAEYVKEKGLAGMALWSIENDSKNAAESLIGQMNKSLNE